MLIYLMPSGPGSQSPKNLDLSGCSRTLTLGLGQESSYLSVLNTVLLSHPRESGVMQLTLSVFTMGVWRMKQWLDLIAILGTNMHFRSLTTLNIDFCSTSPKQATNADVTEMIVTVRKLMSTENMGYNVFVRRHFCDRRISW